MSTFTGPVVHEHDWSAPEFGTEYAPRQWLRWCESPCCQMPGGRHRTLSVSAGPDLPEGWLPLPGYLGGQQEAGEPGSGDVLRYLAAVPGPTEYALYEGVTGRGECSPGADPAALVQPLVEDGLALVARDPASFDLHDL